MTSDNPGIVTSYRRTPHGPLLSLLLHGAVLLSLALLPMAPAALPEPVPSTVVELVTPPPEPPSLIAAVPLVPENRPHSRKPLPHSARLSQATLPMPLPAPATAPAADAAPGGAARGGGGTGQGVGLKDYLRAQIEKRWVLQANALLRNDWVVRIRFSLQQDGRVSAVEVVDDPRLTEDRAFRDFAYSARNAVLLSQPFSLPPGLVDDQREVTLDFNPRQVQQ